MTQIQFLDTLETTLNGITVTGRENCSRMMGIFLAIDEQRREIAKESNVRQMSDKVAKTIIDAKPKEVKKDG